MFYGSSEDSKEIENISNGCFVFDFKLFMDDSTFKLLLISYYNTLRIGKFFNIVFIGLKCLFS